MRLNVLLALAVAIPGLAAAQVATPETAPAPAPKKPVKERKICRQVADSASRMTPKVCHTAAEWDALSRGDSNIERLRRP